MIETVILAVVVLGLLGFFFGLLLGYAAIRFKVEGELVVDRLNNLLPQQQCGKCGYPGCRPYAEALAKGLINGRYRICFLHTIFGNNISLKRGGRHILMDNHILIVTVRFFCYCERFIANC